MRILDPHDGDLGMSAWVDCHRCQRIVGMQGVLGAGWFAIRRGERHWIDRATNQHYHHDCGLALVDDGQAEIHYVVAAVTEKKRMAQAELKPHVKAGQH